MILAFVATAFLATTVCVGCGKKTKEVAVTDQTLKSVQLTTDSLSIEVSVTDRSATHVSLKYRVLNGGEKGIYLYNRLHLGVNNQGVYRTNKNLVNIIVDGSTVVVSKKIVEVPEFMTVEKPNIPCATLVPPHSSFEEIVDLTLPLKEWTPYLRSPKGGQTVREFPLTFEVGYFPSSGHEASILRPVKTTEGKGLYLEGSYSTQKIIKTELPSIRIPVLSQAVEQTPSPRDEASRVTPPSAEPDDSTIV